MGSDKPNDEENPPVFSSPLQTNDEFPFTVRKNEGYDTDRIFKSSYGAGADPVSFPYIPLPVTTQGYMHGTYQSHANDIYMAKGGLITDFSRVGNFQNLRTDVSSTIRNNVPGFLGATLVSQPEENIKRLHQSINSDNMMIADGFHYPQIERNFMPMRGSVNEDCRLIGWENQTAPTFCYPQNSGKIEFSADDKVLPVQLVPQEKIDGSFLTLGIGGKAEASSKLIEAFPPQFGVPHIQQNMRTSSRLDNNFAGDLSSLAYSVGGWASSHNINSGVNINPYNSIQTPEDSVPCNDFSTNNRNLAFVGQRQVKHADIHPCNVPFGNFSPESLNTPLSGQIGRCMQQDHSGQLVPVSNGNVNHADGNGQFFQRIDAQSVGQLLPANKASTSQGRHFPRSMRVQVTEGAQTVSASPFPTGLGFQPLDQGFAQTAKGSQIVGRTSIQTKGNRHLTQGGVAIHFSDSLLGPCLAVGNEHPTQGSEQFCNNFQGSFFRIGQQYDSMTAQVSIDALKSSSSTGQQPQNVMPIQFSRDLFQPASSSGIEVADPKFNGLSQGSNVIGRPSLKRGATRPPSSACDQRRKMMSIPTSHFHMPHPKMPKATSRPHMPPPKQSAFPPIYKSSRAPSPFTAHHIKWQGSEGTPQPTGGKCQLCKRDLSYAPEGPIHQPTVPPPVAVLPCGHTFHDHCLQRITPEGQSKDPPCIPCAIGET